MAAFMLPPLPIYRQLMCPEEEDNSWQQRHTLMVLSVLFEPQDLLMRGQLMMRMLRPPCLNQCQSIHFRTFPRKVGRWRRRREVYYRQAADHGRGVRPLWKNINTVIEHQRLCVSCIPCIDTSVPLIERFGAYWLGFGTVMRIRKRVLWEQESLDYALWQAVGGDKQ